MSDFKKLILFPCALLGYEISAYLANDLYLPALDRVIHDLNTTEFFAQLSITLFILGSGCTQLFTGLISDTVGRRKTILFGGVVFVAASLVGAITTNIMTFLAARFFQATVISTIFVAGYAAIHETLDKKSAIQTLAWMLGISVLAPAFGPLLGSALLKVFHTWRITFWLVACSSFVSLVALFFTMPETLKADAKRLSIAQYFKNYILLCTEIRLLSYSLITSCFLGSMIAWITTGPIIVEDAYNLSSTYFSIFQVLIFGCYIFGTRLVKQLLHYTTADVVVAIGVTMFAVSIFPMAGNLFFASHAALLIIGLCCIALGSGIASSSLQRLAIESTRNAYPMGAKIALYSTINSLAGALCSYLVTLYLNNTSIPLTILCITSAALATLVFLINKKC